jgi:hypothetical protein
VGLAKSRLRREQIWERMLNVNYSARVLFSRNNSDLDGKHQRRPLGYGPLISRAHRILRRVLKDLWKPQAHVEDRLYSGNSQQYQNQRNSSKPPPRRTASRLPLLLPKVYEAKIETLVQKPTKSRRKVRNRKGIANRTVPSHGWCSARCGKKC